MRAARLALLGALLGAACPAAVHAQLVYTPTPPTPGALYRDGQAGRYLLGGTWLYRADPGDIGLSQQWSQDPSTDGWAPVTVPNSYNAGDLSDASMTGYVGWYRRDFTVPAGAFAPHVPLRFRSWVLRFESVNYTATVWLDGRQIGSHVGAFFPFEFQVGALGAGVHRLVVRVDDRRGPADLPPGPSGGWWNFGGIQREVYLRAVQRADIVQAQVRPLLPCPRCAATIAERVVVENYSSSAQLVSLKGSYGPIAVDFGRTTIAPHSRWTASQMVPVPRPQLWSLTHPHLYSATLTLSDAKGRRLGGYFTYSGIRSVVLTAGGRLKLNGRLLDLRGVDLHEQNIQTGAALSPAQLAQLVSWTRAIGATIIRSHYPLNPQIEEAADRYGILLWSEIPVYQVSDQYLSQPDFLARAHAMLEQNIFTNQNHPAVLLWSIANELTTPATLSEARYIYGAVKLAHQLDPTRPVGMAISDWPGVPCQSAYNPLDVVGFNEYFGVFDVGGGATDDRDALGPFLDSLRACYPKKAIFVSEFGFEANRDGPVEERGTYSNQSNSIAYHLNVFATKRWLSGAIYWILQDFAARPGWGGADPRPDPPFVQKGVVDTSGNPKPAFSVISSLYHAWLRAAARDLRHRHRV
jgi:beta-glucuronidase